MVKLLSIVFLILILMSSRAYAISLGSTVKSDFAKVKSDSSVKFTILFWNTNNDSYEVKLSIKEAPEDWTIIIEPNNFILNATAGKEQIKLPYKDDYVKATPIDVIVKPILNEKPGKNNIAITANSFLSQNGIILSQERLFKFVVEVENPLFFEEIEENKPNLTTSQKNQYNSLSQEKNISVDYYFYSIFALAILIISFFIYKYS